jgi:transposase
MQADCTHRFRQQHSLPVLNALKAWLDAIAPKVVPGTKLGDALSYTLNMRLPDALHQRRQDADR